MQLRYYVVNNKTHIMHIHGFCAHTKPRKIPIRLFESIPSLEEYAGHSLRLCKTCESKFLDMEE